LWLGRLASVKPFTIIVELCVLCETMSETAEEEQRPLDYAQSLSELRVRRVSMASYLAGVWVRLTIVAPFGPSSEFAELFVT